MRERFVMLSELVSFNIENGQSDASLVTGDYSRVTEFVGRGWSCAKYRDGFYLRAPNAWLTDVTDPRKILAYGDPLVNLAYFLFISKRFAEQELSSFIDRIIQKNYVRYGGLEYAVVTGPIVESEYRITGSDSRIGELKLELFREFKSSPDFGIYLRKARERLPSFRSLRSMKMSLYTQSMDVQKLFAALDSVFSVLEKEVYNERITLTDFSPLPPFDRALFALTGCFNFLSTFVASVKSEARQLGFIEVHSDPYKQGSSYYNSDVEEGETVLAIDTAYSGKTIELLAGYIEKRGAKAVRVGVYPKSLIAVKRCDYIVVADRLLPVSGLHLTKDWPAEVYAQVLSA